MAQFQARHCQLKNEFLADYPTEKANSQYRLNGLHDDSLWQDFDTVKDKFHFEIRLLPTPTEGEWADWLGASIKAGAMRMGAC